MTHTLTDSDVRYSHLVDDTEKMRTAALRNARRIDGMIADLQHAIEHGRVTAAVDMLTTLDRANRAAITALTPAE